MRFEGNLDVTLNGLNGATALSAYAKEKAKVAELWSTSGAVSTGTRPDDDVIFSDPYGYLRVVLNNADWDGVTRWYATRLTEILKNSTRPPDFWNLSKLNLQNYCDRTLTLRDLRSFTEKCILVMCVADYGNKVGFGYAGKRDDLNLAMFFANGLSHNDGQLNWFTSFDHAKAGTRYGFCIGWVKEPAKHTASRIIVALGAAFIGAAAFSALTAPTAAATSGGAAAGTGTGASAGASAGAIVPSGIETVTVVGSAAPVVTAGSVAAGLSAGAIAVVATPPPLSTPTLETVTVTGAAPATGVSVATVGAGLSAGAVAVATAPPPLSTPSIETVTVEAPRVEHQPVSPTETAATGLISVGISYPALNLPNAPNPQYDYENSLQDRIKDNLRDAAEQYGQQWIEEHLAEWLREQLGREPTPVELQQYEDYISPYSPASLMRNYLPIVIGALVIAALINRVGS